ncbi:MAG: CBS domain-containing protein [Dichotomicrobium sp.]
MNVTELLPQARRRLVKIGHDAKLICAARTLGDPSVELVVVCDDDERVAGVVSRTDILARISQCTGCTCAEAVATAMTRDVVSCDPCEPLSEIWSRMKATGHRQLPVVDADNHPLGVLSAREVLERLLADKDYEESLLIEYIASVGYR